MQAFDYLKFIKQILSFSPRQGGKELLVAKFIEDNLEKYGVSYQSQIFNSSFPDCKKAEIIADGKPIVCMGTSFVSGKIADKSHLISSLTSSQTFRDENINFNPKSNYFSLSNYYFSPSVCVKKSSLGKILAASDVQAEIVVKKREHQSKNILVGNLIRPQSIVFTHFDSVEMGAVDNASGVSVLMKLVLENQSLLNSNLFVFAGNEELSYDEPVYWGHGYREFEKKYSNLLSQARKIIVVDSVGNDKPNISKDKDLQKLAFPVKKLKDLSKKIILIYGSLDKLMEVYHSNGDNISQINPEYLDESFDSLKNELLRD